MQPVSAYVPCYNNDATILATLTSLQQQSHQISELFVIDDGSSDSSAQLAEGAGVQVIRLDKNQGRGAVRALAMSRAANEFVLCCDAGKSLSPDFLSKALEWMKNDTVCAVQGKIVQTASETVADRWRGRHLLKLEEPLLVRHKASLITAGCLVRRSAVLSVGNFNDQLRHTEDKELGDRLLESGYDVVEDPSLEVMSIGSQPLLEVLERYRRWYAGTHESVDARGYFKQIVYSVKVMAARDLKAGDPICVPITLLSPHYSFWKSLLVRRGKGL